MKRVEYSGATNERTAPLELTPDEFRALGYALIDRIAGFLDSLPARPVSPNETVKAVQGLLGDGSLPVGGTDPGRLLEETAELLFEHSLFNGHPRFWGYITSSAAPIGALAELLASAVNPNLGAWALSPLASEIERQTVRWIAELIGYPPNCGGLLVSGGNMANFIGLLLARKAKVPWDAQTAGMNDGEGRTPRVYASAETHTWLEKAADQYGLGTEAVR